MHTPDFTRRYALGKAGDAGVRRQTHGIGESQMTNSPRNMTINELKGILELEQFIPSTYSLTGGRHQDAYCLSHEGDNWFVYYSERGEEIDKVSFSSESEACNDLLQKMRRDPGTKNLL